jgi:biotin carboxylase
VRCALITDDFDAITVAVARCLLAAGQSHVSVLARVSRSGAARSRRLDIIDVDTHDGDAVEAALRARAAEHGRVIVFPIHEEAIVRTAGWASTWSEGVTLAPGPSADLCHRVDHKGQFHELAVEHGLPVPAGVRVRTADTAEVRAAVAHLHLPVLVKPPLGFGGRGIERCATIDDVVEAIGRIAVGTQVDVVVQEFVAGSDVGCSFLASAGEILACTVQRGLLANRTPFKPPVCLRFERHAEVEHAVGRLAMATRWNGVANVDLRLPADGGEPTILEINPRYWQTLIGSMAAGVNFPALHLSLALGHPMHATPTATTFLDLHTLTSSAAGLRSTTSVRPQHVRGIHPRVYAIDPVGELAQLGAHTRRGLRATAGALRRQARRS